MPGHGAGSTYRMSAVGPESIAIPEAVSDLNMDAHAESVLAPSTSTQAEQAAFVEKARSLPVTGEFDAVVDTKNLPDLPMPGDPQEGTPFAPVTGAAADGWHQLIQAYEREAEALGGNSTAGAPLLLEVGRIYEEELGQPRQAASAYQRAFNHDPKNPSILNASRRLFTEVGNWAMVVQIIGYEIEGAKSDERRATLYAEKGTILEDKLHNPEEAQRAFRAALDAWSAEPLALNALERLHLYRKEHEPLYELYQKALVVADKNERRLPLLLTSAQLAEDRLDDPASALRHYREIVELDESNAVALEAMRRLTLQTEQWDDYVRVLSQAADLSDDPRVAAQHLVAAARVLHDKKEDPEKALLLLLKALEGAPDELVILKEIELLYAQNDRMDEVVKVLRREAEVTADPRERVPILARLGAILEDQLGLIDEAIMAFEEAVQQMPSYLPARQALGRLYRRTERWPDLADLFRREAEVETEQSAKVNQLFKLAELQGGRLDDVDGAIASLRSVLALEPNHRPAWIQLESLFSTRGDWGALVSLLEDQFKYATDPDQQLFLLGRIGQIAEEKADDIDSATGAYERMLEVRPEHLVAIQSLVRLKEKQQRFAEMLTHLEAEIDLTEEPAALVQLHFKAGTVLQTHLGRHDDAISRFEEVLKLEPEYLPALRSVGKLYAETSNGEALLALYRREMEATDSTESQIALLFRMADVAVDLQKDEGKAIELLQEVLDKDETNLPALRALAELHSQRGENELLVEVLRREADSLTNPAERAGTLLKVADLCEERLDRADQAAEVYQEILRLGHDFDAAIRGLVRIYSAAGLWNALSRALKTAYEHAQDDRTKAAILVRSAEVAGDKLGNLDGAAENLERALELEPNRVTILSQLERISVARRDWRRATAVSMSLAQHETDPRLYAARQIRIAVMKETQLDPPESGAEHYRLALETVPDHPVALKALELAYLRGRNWDGLVALYHREALLTTDSARQVVLFTRAAEVAENRLKNDDSAAELYTRALDIDSHYLPALHGRRRIAERQQDTSLVLETLQAEGAVSADVAHAKEVLYEAARVRQDRLGDISGAIETYQMVLSRAPDHLGAFNRLEAIYLEREAWHPLLDLLQRRAVAVNEPVEQARLLEAAGEITQDRLHDTDTAMGLYREVLIRDENNEKALVRLGPLLFEREAWDESIEVFHRTLANTKDPAAHLTALKALGVIYQEHRQDLVKSVQSFQAALQADPGDTESLRRLATVYQGAQDWKSAVNVLLRLAEAEPDPRAKIDTLLELGRIYADGANDRSNAILAYRKVLELDAGNMASVLKLTELYELEGDWNALADVTATYVRMLAPEEKHKAAPLHLKMADVFETRMNDDNRAINALKYALEAEPDSADALEQLARLYAKEPDSFPQAIAAHRQLLKLDPFRVTSYREMHRMFERLGQHDKAFVAAEVLVVLRAQQQDEDLYYHEHKSRVAPRAFGQLSDKDHERLLVHPLERGAMREILAVLGGELSKLYPGDLAPYELNRNADRQGPKSRNPLWYLANELADVLGAPPYELLITKKHELGLFIENTKPPSLIVGANVGLRVQDKDQRFLLARQLERLRGGHHLLDRIPDAELETIFWSVAKLADSMASVPVDSSRLDAMTRTLARTLPTRIRRDLEAVGSRLFKTHVDVNKHRRAAYNSANRAGLVVTNDLEVAIRHIARAHPDVRPVWRDADGARETIGQVEEIRDLLCYAVSEEYLSIRSKLGFSIQS